MPNPICNNSRLVFFASPASRNPSSTSIVDRFHSSSDTISYPSEGFRGKEYSILFRLAFGRRSLAFHRSGVELVVTDNKTHASGWVEQTVNKLNPHIPSSSLRILLTEQWCSRTGRRGKCCQQTAPHSAAKKPDGHGTPAQNKKDMLFCRISGVAPVLFQKLFKPSVSL